MATLNLRFGLKITRGSELQGFVEVCCATPGLLNTLKCQKTHSGQARESRVWDRQLGRQQKYEVDAVGVFQETG